MLEPLLGSASRERVLMFIAVRGEGYAREMARFYGVDLTPIQKQLEALELGGVLVSRTAGRTRLYAFNPRYAFLAELQALLAKALDFYPIELKNNLQMSRQRPRRSSKPL